VADDQSAQRYNLAGGIAFVCVIVTCYSTFLFQPRLGGSEARLVLTFVLGAVHAALFILGSSWSEGRDGWRRALYYVVQCAVLTALLHVSPLRGFFGIITLPLFSQALLDLRLRHALPVGLVLYGANLSVWGGWAAMLQAAFSYLAAFAFTAVFTWIARQANLARERSEELAGQLEDANSQLRVYAEQIGELATTRERNRLAREIHDGVGHYLAVVKTQLDVALALLPDRPQAAREAVAKSARLAGEALDEVRRSVGALAPASDRATLVEALRHLAQAAAPPTTVRVEGEPRPLGPAAEHALFRAAQEGLTNLRKHAAARTASVVLDYRAPDRVRLAVLDDGRGAGAQSADASPAPAAGGGFGLVGLRERLALLGGTLEAGNRSEGGFALRVEVPA
jgi:signal transduction histidine kinase